MDTRPSSAEAVPGTVPDAATEAVALAVAAEVGPNAALSVVPALTVQPAAISTTASKAGSPLTWPNLGSGKVAQRPAADRLDAKRPA